MKYNIVFIKGAYMEILHEFLRDFLQKRNMPYPNGMMLYAYQMNKAEYEDLRNKLKYCCQYHSLVDLLKNKYFSRCFVLYASEWWKREYKGGAWSWDPIFSSISNDELKIYQSNVRTNAIIEALQYWKYNITLVSGKKYLGAIVANGGIPSKFIQAASKNSPVVKILHHTIRFATEHTSNGAELFAYVKNLQKILPEAIRKDEICELITSLVTTIIKLKIDYKLQEYKNPIQILNQRAPDWKSQFPLLMEDASVEKMLSGFVEEASRSTGVRVQGKIPTVERILDLENSNKLKFQFIFPEFNVEAKYFSKYFGITDVNTLPQTFYINNLDSENTTIAIVNLILGSKKQYKIRQFDDRLDVKNSVTLFLSSADNKIQSNSITISQSIDVNRPLVFTENEDGLLILKNNGSAYLRESECFIAYNEKNNDYSSVGEYVTDIVIDDIVFRLIKCKESFEFDDFFVQLNSSNPSNNKYCVEGNIITYKTFPFVAYRGIPKIIYYDETSKKNDVSSRYINYYYKDTTHPIVDINKFSGNLDINCTHGGISKTFSVTILPPSSSINFNALENGNGVIKLNSLNAIKIEPLLSDSLKCTVVDGCEFQFETTTTKPDKVCFKIYWYSGGTSLIYLPYPSVGVSFFDENKKCINSSNISLVHLMGKRIRIFNNLKSSSKYKLHFELRTKVRTSKNLSLTRHIYTNDVLTEIKLIDFEDNIKNLFGYSENEDDKVKISITLENKNLGFINVSRYDTHLLLETQSVYIPPANFGMYTNDMLKNTIVKAINLSDPECEPVILEQKMEDQICTGYWSIEPIDLKKNCYILVSDKKSQINTKPLILYSDTSLDELTELYKLVILKNEISYSDASFEEIEEAVLEADNKQQIKDIILANLSDFSSDVWKDISSLKQIFVSHDIPLSSMNLWQILCSDEKILCRLLIYFSSDRFMLQKIKEEVISVPATIPFSLWEPAIEEYLNYIKTTFSSIPGMEEILKSQINEQFNILSETFPEIELAVYYSLCGLLSKFYNFLILGNIVPHVSIANTKSIKELSDEIFTKQVFDEYGNIVEMCWMHQLQTQNSLEEDNWIYLPFDKVYNEIKVKHPVELSNLEKHLFRLNKFNYFIEDVVNFPQVCAFYSFYQELNSNPSNINELIKFSIKDFINFNQNYFIEVYKIAISIMLNQKLAG